MTLGLTPDRFPFQFQSKTITVTQVELFLKVNKDFDYTTALKLFFQPTPPVPSDGFALEKDATLNDLPHGTKTFTSNASLGPWTLLAKDSDILATSLSLPVNPPTPARLNPEAIEDIWILCHYTVTP